jgi:UDP-4-amino-4,6-dideoxy-N-acetyl-beta-L-altrosamine transaminase
MTLLPYGKQSIDDDDVKAVVAALRDPMITCGRRVEMFESALAKRCGVRHAVVTSSGTTALAAAYFAAGVGAGDEVITTPLTFSATANAAVQLGARIVFADIDPTTLNLSPEETERKLSARTRAIAAVDYAGEPADLRRLRRLAHARGALLVQDAAHALGATLDGEPIAQLADLTTLSFHPVKHITTGEGGALLTDDARLAERARRFRGHGIVREAAVLAPTLAPNSTEGPWFYDLPEIGINARLSDIQCALGLSQLGKLERFLARRRALARRYFERLSGDERLFLPPARSVDQHAWHIFPIRLAGGALRVAERRRRTFERLRAAGIGVQVHYVPVNALAAYRALGHRPEETPHAWDAYHRLITLPLHAELSDAEQDRVLAALEEALA